MATSLPCFRAPTAGFEVPLEMLAACHLRIVDRCETLRRLVAHLAAQGIDEDARGAAAGILRYFDTAAQDHHADEETDLFPALIESMAGSDAVCIRQMIESLEADHGMLDAYWRRLRPELSKIAAGEDATLPAKDVDAFAALYDRHIAREEAELLPMAARLLGDDALEAIGRAMRERRGIAADA